MLTIKKLYNWAKRVGVENYVITVPDNSTHGTTDSVAVTSDETCREVLIFSEEQS